MLGGDTRSFLTGGPDSFVASGHHGSKTKLSEQGETDLEEGLVTLAGFGIVGEAAGIEGDVDMELGE